MILLYILKVEKMKRQNHEYAVFIVYNTIEL